MKFFIFAVVACCGFLQIESTFAKGTVSSCTCYNSAGQSITKNCAAPNNDNCGHCCDPQGKIRDSGTVSKSDYLLQTKTVK